jgi:hypothetical protein
VTTRPDTAVTPVTWATAYSLGPFARYRKVTLALISKFTVPPGTPFETPKGLRADDEECRIAFDSQGGVYPIRESVFRETYIEVDLGEELQTIIDRLEVIHGENGNRDPETRIAINYLKTVAATKIGS